VTPTRDAMQPDAAEVAGWAEDAYGLEETQVCQHLGVAALRRLGVPYAATAAADRRRLARGEPRLRHVRVRPKTGWARRVGRLPYA
jgi:hypothetical protein